MKNFKTHKKNQNMSGGGGEAGETWFFVSFIAPWWRNGCFKRPQRFQLL